MKKQLVTSLLLASTFIHNAYAQESTSVDAIDPTTSSATESQSWWSNTWNQGWDKGKKLYHEGSNSLLLPFHTHHGRNTYTPERIRELNEKTWGLGFYSSLRDTPESEEALFAMLISDSHFRPQGMFGYARQWFKQVGPIELGAGWTGLLISRTDYFKGLPFPIALPVASIGTKEVKLMASYVPRLSKNKGNGDVLFLFMKFELN